MALTSLCTVGFAALPTTADDRAREVSAVSEDDTDGAGRPDEHPAVCHHMATDMNGWTPEGRRARDGPGLAGRGTRHAHHAATWATAEGAWAGVPTDDDIMAYHPEPVGITKCVSSLNVVGIATVMARYVDVDGDGEAGTWARDAALTSRSCSSARSGQV